MNYLARFDTFTTASQPLVEHLTRTAEKCALFARQFGMENTGYIIGFFHDAGKWREEWQEYLKQSKAYNDYMHGAGPATECPKEMTHAPESAKYLVDRLLSMWSGSNGDNGLFLDIYKFALIAGNVICSHHGELHDMNTPSCDHDIMKEIMDTLKSSASGKPCVIDGINGIGADGGAMFDAALCSRFAAARDEMRRIAPDNSGDYGRRDEYAIRFLYSCLVDADRLQSEEYELSVSGRQSVRGQHDGIGDLLSKINGHVAKIESRLSSNPSKVNMLRAETRKSVVSKAKRPNGIYSLPMPTGSGKTITGLQFAMEHAMHNGKSRVIIALPLTSIVDQTSAECRKILGDRNVLEHHSDFDPYAKYRNEKGEISAKDKKKADKDFNAMMKLAENWDMPVVVTTTVQLFESILLAHGSRLRKLHNIANSVIILDEEQYLPIHQLYPILTALNMLVNEYGCTIIRSSATLPSFVGHIVGHGQNEVRGYDSCVPLIDDPHSLYEQFKRLDVENLGVVEIDDFAGDHLDSPQSVLSIFNTRKTCRELYKKCGKPESDKYLLSTDLPPVIRHRYFDEISSRLDRDEPITVCATSLAEAGVNFDFNETLRDKNSLYSILQTAGRCNRHGRMKNAKAYYFQLAGVKPNKQIAAELNSFTNIEETVTGKPARQLKAGWTDDELADEYSKSYFNNPASAKIICDSRKAYDGQYYGKHLLFNFRAFADSFHMIEETGRRNISLVIKLDSHIGDLLSEIQSGKSNLKIVRELNQYVVMIDKSTLDALLANGMAEELVDGSTGGGTGIYVLSLDKKIPNIPWSDKTGLDFDRITSTFLGM